MLLILNIHIILFIHSFAFRVKCIFSHVGQEEKKKVFLKLGGVVGPLDELGN